MKIKICGMKYKENLEAVAALLPDFLGFIFHTASPRYMAHNLQPYDLAELPGSIIKTGVFVNEEYEKVLNTVLQYDLGAVQVHGNERPAYISKLKSSLPGDVMVIKAFGIDDSFNWSALNDYQDYCDMFLFDTKTSKYGGSGKRFNISLLDQYQLDIPVMVAGGLGLDELEDVFKYGGQRVSVVDMNSKLELEPGMKDVELMKKAIERVRQIKDNAL